MNRQRYVIRNSIGESVAEILTPDGQTPEVPPWVAENIHSSGWSIEKFEVVKTDVEIHGAVDWKRVAEEMAVPLRQMLADDVPAETEEQVEEIFGQAQQALDGFDVAMMEVSMAHLTAEEPRPEPPRQEEGSDDD